MDFENIRKQMEEADRIQLTETDVAELIPHRPPFLFVREVGISWIKREGEPDLIAASAFMDVGAACALTGDGHFGVLPGTLIQEAFAQACAVLARFMQFVEGDGQMLAANPVGFAKAEVEWPTTAMPHDAVQLCARFVRRKMGVWVFEGDAIVEDPGVRHVLKVASLKGAELKRA